MQVPKVPTKTKKKKKAREKGLDASDGANATMLRRGQ